MVSAIDWLIGGTALSVLIFCLLFGILTIFYAKKLKARLLYYAGVLIFFTGGFYLGASADFLAVLITGTNIPNEYGLHGILSFMWVAPAVIFAIYLGAELIISDKKWYILSIYVILSVIFELFLFLDTSGSFNFEIPPGRELIDSSFVLGSPTFILIAIFLMSALFFNGIGFLIKAIQSTGNLRKKFAFLSTGFIIFVLCGALDSLITPGIWLIVIRFGMISSTWLMYLGLKPT